MVFSYALFVYAVYDIYRILYSVYTIALLNTIYCNSRNADFPKCLHLTKLYVKKLIHKTQCFVYIISNIAY